MKRYPGSVSTFYLIVVFLLCSVIQIELKAQFSVPTQHNNNARTGLNNKEKTLNTSNVNVKNFGKRGSFNVDDQVYAQVLIISNLNMPSIGIKNVLFIATVNNSVYAFDADAPGGSNFLWKKNFNGPNIVPPRNTDMNSFACNGKYLDFSGNMGIVSTPVIDTISGTIYVLARTKENGTNYVQKLHSLSIFDGSEKSNSPVTITASIAGNGTGSVNGIITFNSQIENQRAALLLTNNVVYITWASHCDGGPYHGWIIGYDATALTQKYVYNVTPNGSQGGIWMSGQGITADETGNLYVSTGNGTVGYNGNPRDPINRGESFIKLTPSANSNKLNISSWFTPYNYAALNNADLDLGSSGPILIPNTNLMVAGGKGGVVYVVDKDNMGGLNTLANDNQIIQSITVLTGPEVHLHGSTVYYNGPTGEFIYTWLEFDHLKAYKFDRAVGKFIVPYSSISSMAAPDGMPGGMLSVSSDGNKPGTGIVWAAHPLIGDANYAVRPGMFRAFDATDLSKELWNSQQNPLRDSVGSFAKFNSPTIANGKVYLPTFTNQVHVYGAVDTIFNLALRNPDNPVNTTQGLNYAYYQSTLFSSTQEIDYMTPIKTGSVTNFDLTPKMVADDFAFKYTGYINVPTDGLYTFYTNSDDGSNLYIGDQWIVNNDGSHAPTERSGKIGLMAGKHAITVTYFDKSGGETLVVSYSGPGINKQAIPSSALFMNGIAPPPLRDPDNPVNTVSGLDYNYYEGTFTSLPDFNSLTSLKSGKVATFDISPRINDTNYAFKFTGYVNIPADGQYTFFSNSDDGSDLYIGNQLLINNDGQHAAQEVSGTIGLKAGKHYITVTYFQVVNSQVLTVSYSSNTIIKQAIPASALFSTGVVPPPNLRDPENPANTVSGLDYSYYEGSFKVLPNFSTLTPVKTGKVATFDISPKQRNTNFAFKFTGYVNVTIDGNYTFYSNSNDGSKLFIGNQLIINNDGEHGAKEISGTIGLKAGKHSITVLYFQATNSSVLTVSYAGPTLAKQAIPASALFSTGIAPPPQLRDPENPTSTVSGLDYSYYNGSFNTLPDFTTLTPAKTGKIATFDLSPRLNDVAYAFKFTGYVNIPADGQYTFYSNSNDGSKLFIGNQLLINNDGAHTAKEVSGTIGLKTGKHAITVTYFQNGGSQVLAISYSGPSISKQIIPASALYSLPGSSSAKIISTDIETTEATALLYPMPVVDYLNINWTDESGDAEIMITALTTGAIVMKKTVKMTGNYFRLDLTELTNGMYLLSIRKGDKQFERKIEVLR